MKLISFYCDVDGGNFYKNSSKNLIQDCIDFGIELFSTYGFGVDSQVTKEVSEKWKSLKAPKYVYNNLIIFKKHDL